MSREAKKCNLHAHSTIQTRLDYICKHHAHRHTHTHNIDTVVVENEGMKIIHMH